MKVHNIKNAKVRNIIEDLIDSISDMTMGEYAKFLQGIPKTYNYSFLNTMIISLSGGTWVNGFKAWKKYNRRVSKGAKAIKILYPLISTKTVTDKKTGERKKETRLYGFRYTNVFDVSSTEAIDGKEPKEFDVTKVDTIQSVSLEELIGRVKESGIKVQMKEMKPSIGGTLSYMADGSKVISLNSLRSEADNKRTLVHELAHYVFEHNQSDKETKIKEIEAESLTYLTLRLIGNDESALNFSVGYIKSWEGDKNPVNVWELQSRYGKILKILNLKERYSSKNKIFDLF